VGRRAGGGDHAPPSSWALVPVVMTSVHPRSTAGGGCPGVPRCRDHVPVSSSYVGYHSLQTGAGVSFQGPSMPVMYNL
jgi:hypothetical protein